MEHKEYSTFYWKRSSGCSTGIPAYVGVNQSAHRRPNQAIVAGSWARVARGGMTCWNFTDTSFETPGSCIVTPYIDCADSIVFLECVIRMNCVSSDISLSSRVSR